MNNANTTTNEALENSDLIEQWLVEQGYLVKHSDGENRAWVLEITDHLGILFYVSQHISRKDEIVIGTAYDIDGDLSKRFSGLKENERNSWLWDLRLRLLNQDIESDGVKYPLKSIILFQFIYRDGLTKDTFFQRLFHVRKGLQIVATMICRRFNLPLSSSPTDKKGLVN